MKVKNFGLMTLEALRWSSDSGKIHFRTESASYGRDSRSVDRVEESRILIELHWHSTIIRQSWNNQYSVCIVAIS